MKFSATSVVGAWLLDIEPIEDERGFFARSLCADELNTFGLEMQIKQQNISRNLKCGMIRGLHYQIYPYEEIKLVRVTKGRIYDVIVDLRVDSSSYLQWYSVELTSENHRTIYIPKGVAHGFQTLEDNTEVFYQMSCEYASDYSCGVLWNDPTFSITWPIENPILSTRDKNFKNYSETNNYVVSDNNIS